MGFEWDWGWDFDWSWLTTPEIAPWSTVVWLLLNMGAAFRLARLVSKDAITDRPRNAIQERYHGMLVNLLLCMWCLGFWFAIAAVFLTSWQTTQDLWLIIAGIFTISTFVGWLGEHT